MTPQQYNVLKKFDRKFTNYRDRKINVTFAAGERSQVNLVTKELLGRSFTGGCACGPNGRKRKEENIKLGKELAELYLSYKSQLEGK